MPAPIPRPVIVGRIIRTGDELVEAVYKTQEDEDDEYLSEPFRQCTIGGFDFAARYRGFVGIGAEGAVAWGCSAVPDGVFV